MSRIINQNVPEIGDLIFTHLDDHARFQCRRVSKHWKQLADKSLIPTYRNLLPSAYFGTNMDFFKFLLDHVDLDGFDFDWNLTQPTIDEYTQTAFMEQCMSGNLEMVEWIVQNSEAKEIDLNANFDGWTGFRVACTFDQINIVEYLLNSDKDIDWNAQDELGITAFIDACRSGHIEMVKLLLDNSNSKGINLNAQAEDGVTAFIAACKSGKTEIIKLLLENSQSCDIDLNARDDEGKTAFMLACEQGRIDIVQKMLEDSGSIDFNVQDNEGMTGFMLACKIDKHHELLSIVASILEFSKSRNINLEAINNYGRDAVMIIKGYGHTIYEKAFLLHAIAECVHSKAEEGNESNLIPRCTCGARRFEDLQKNIRDHINKSHEGGDIPDICQILSSLLNNV